MVLLVSLKFLSKASEEFVIHGKRGRLGVSPEFGAYPKLLEVSMNAFRHAALGAIVACLSSCVTTPPKPEYEASRVVERIGDKEDTPEWAHADAAMMYEGADVAFIHQMSMAGNSRSEACLKAAELDGRAAMIRYIKENISASGQVNETNALSDPGYEALTAFLAQGKLSGVHVKERYWEKREESSESGERVLRMRCVVRLAVDRNTLEQQLREALNGGKGGNPKIREQLLESQKNFFENIGKEAPAH